MTGVQTCALPILSIGHRGGVVADGSFMSMKQLRKLFNSRKSNGKRVVIRSHPRSPKDVTNQVIEMAMEADRKFVIDSTTTPFVPSTSTED